MRRSRRRHCWSLLCTCLASRLERCPDVLVVVDQLWPTLFLPRYEKATKLYRQKANEAQRDLAGAVDAVNLTRHQDPWPDAAIGQSRTSFRSPSRRRSAAAVHLFVCARSRILGRDFATNASFPPLLLPPRRRNLMADGPERECSRTNEAVAVMGTWTTRWQVGVTRDRRTFAHTPLIRIPPLLRRLKNGANPMRDVSHVATTAIGLVCLSDGRPTGPTHRPTNQPTDRLTDRPTAVFEVEWRVFRTVRKSAVLAIAHDDSRTADPFSSPRAARFAPWQASTAFRVGVSHFAIRLMAHRSQPTRSVWSIA